MSKVNLTEKAKACFEANPKAQKFYQTNDGQCFVTEHAAYQHGKTIGDTNYNKVVREEKAVGSTKPTEPAKSDK